MKNLLFIALSLFLGLNSNAQIFGGESVTVYGIKFKAKEVTGQSKFNSTSDFYRTKILEPLYETNNNEYLNRLGTYRNSVATTEANDLFNLSLQDNIYPFLDKIDFDFYKSKGFDKVIKEVPGIENDEVFKNLRFRLDTAKSLVDKKNILFESKYLVIRNQLVLSRYDVIVKTFSVDKKKVSKATAEFKAQLDTIVINNNLEGSANIRAYLNRLADEAVIIKGFYYDARLDPTYIGTIKFYLKNTPQIDIGNDKFAFYLKEYINSQTAAANTGLVAIQLAGTYDKSKVSIDSISTDLQTKFNIPADKAAKVAASISFTFSKSETTTFKNQFSSIFVLRYFTSKIFDDLTFSDQKFFGIYNDK